MCVPPRRYRAKNGAFFASLGNAGIGFDFDCNPVTCGTCDGTHLLDSGYRRIGIEVYDTLMSTLLGGEDAGLLAQGRSGPALLPPGRGAAPWTER